MQHAGTTIVFALSIALLLAICVLLLGVGRIVFGIARYYLQERKPERRYQHQKFGVFTSDGDLWSCEFRFEGREVRLLVGGTGGVQRWLKENGVRTLYIEPGSPWQNGFVESFHGRFRDECLNREQFHTLTECRVVTGDYRQEYNQFRPHSRLGYLSPAAYAQRIGPSPVPVGLRPPSTGDGQFAVNQQPSTNA